MSITQTFTTPTTAPSRTQDKTTFDINVENRLAWESTHVAELTAWTTQANALVVAGTLTEVQDTSTTSNSIGTGSKTFTVTAGKSFVAGMTLLIADTAAPTTNTMLGQITSYTGTSLVVNVTATNGSGTKTAWTISQSYPVDYTIPATQGGTGQTSYTDGQLLIGNSSDNRLTKATLTAGSGISITNGNGSITLATSAVGSIIYSALTQGGF